MTSALTSTAVETLIPAALRTRLAGQLINEHSGMTGDEAVRIVDQAVAFLKTCVDNPGKHFRPSRKVDLGWHQFILNTVDYAEFCQRVAGYFIHHVPDEFTSPGGGSAETARVLSPTVEAMRASGFVVDAELWSVVPGQCTQCHQGCTNCGQGDGVLRLGMRG
ncbi:glycine-rich domain-containing protein [Umezawaea sp. NPDC059074]|uniref:glycine-rich domain-containing protein n=1 Tax=Umezawaea sp. NPDC059074 TaxID=3346716 RepID=UPI0036C6831B